jgi:hypothetical protein
MEWGLFVFSRRSYSMSETKCVHESTDSVECITQIQQLHCSLRVKLFIESARMMIRCLRGAPQMNAMTPMTWRPLYLVEHSSLDSFDFIILYQCVEV